MDSEILGKSGHFLKAANFQLNFFQSLTLPNINIFAKLQIVGLTHCATVMQFSHVINFKRLDKLKYKDYLQNFKTKDLLVTFMA